MFDMVNLSLYYSNVLLILQVLSVFHPIEEARDIYQMEFHINEINKISSVEMNLHLRRKIRNFVIMQL